jgi:probable F420-dependent oxidoreductase
MAVELGPVGIWSPSPIWEADGPAESKDARSAIAELDELGYGALWLGRSNGDLKLVEALLAASSRIVLATGILNIWAYPAAQVAENAHRLIERYPGRFLLGLGASHAPAVEALGKDYRRPLGELDRYLDDLDGATNPVRADRRMLAALGPRALALAARRSLGAHPYLTTPTHTEMARREMGADALLAPEQKVVLEPDLATARQIARQHLSYYLKLPNYVQNFRRLGFTDDDVSGAGSDLLVDALYVRGVDAAAERVREHRDAGADHVCLQVVTAEPDPASRASLLPRQEWRDLAAALLVNS